MKVICIANSGKDLSERTLLIGNTEETQFELEIGRTYFVYGITIFEDVVHYLLIDDEGLPGRPSWYPAELFNVADHVLPIEWYYNFFGYQDYLGISAIWGYKELALDRKHYMGLIEREAKAIEIFLKRKNRMNRVDNY